MKMKPLITAISIAIVTASVSAVAAPADNTRTLPVRTADSMPSIAKKLALMYKRIAVAQSMVVRLL